MIVIYPKNRSNFNFEALFSSFVSTTCFFIETLVLYKYKCLPSQTGYTVFNKVSKFPEGDNSFVFIYLRRNYSEVNRLHCDGWYLGWIQAFFVGLTIRHTAFGGINCFVWSKQEKVSFYFELCNHGSTALYLSLSAYLFCLVGMNILTIFIVVRVYLRAEWLSDIIKNILLYKKIEILLC